MLKKKDDINTVAGEFTADVRAAFGDKLRSVILYGPAARGETPKEREHAINFLVVVDDNTPSELARCAPYLAKWRKKRITMPLFLTRGYIARSCDTFPLEFMAMKLNHRLIDGEDVLTPLVFAPADVREQCERELKGKLLHLRAEYLALRGNAKGLMDLVNRSLATFRPVFTGALFIKGITAPDRMDDLLNAIIKAYGLDSTLYEKLTALSRGVKPADEREADRIFDRYIEDMDSLAAAFDAIQPPEEA